MVGGTGKFANLNRLLAAARPDQYDWLLVIDDDVVLPIRFLEVFLSVAEHFRLRIVQPAHRMVSHASWPVTRRSPFAIARTTNFVEIGPVTALHRDAIPTLTPFPADGMGHGLDFEWARTARERGWPIGVVDLTPIVHLLPAGSSYSMSEAAAAGRKDLYQRPETKATFRRWDEEEL
jgi:GT2 family glycosyltransferase